MFTGIIEATAKIIAKTDAGFTIERPAFFDDIKLGSSISVSGVCLTIVELTDVSMRFDVIAETWNKTKLPKLFVGDMVNLERAMSAGARLDGHIVQGHVEGTAEVVTPATQDIAELTIRIPEQLTSFIVPKGSITIDGVSLTVAAFDGNLCTVALIPHTLRETTLGILSAGESVNIETDVLVRGRLHS